VTGPTPWRGGAVVHAVAAVGHHRHHDMPRNAIATATITIRAFTIVSALPRPLQPLLSGGER